MEWNTDQNNSNSEIETYKYLYFLPLLSLSLILIQVACFHISDILMKIMSKLDFEGRDRAQR